MSPRRVILASLLALCVPASSASAIQIGISDQHSAMFANPYFAPLHMRYARLVVPWNIAQQKASKRQPFADWINAALFSGVEPHIAFGDPFYLDKNKGKGPTPARYRAAVVAFRKRWPKVKVFTPWNEATVSFAPTFHRPELAAAYYRQVKSVCPSCQVVGADMLDLPNLPAWLSRYQAAMRKSRTPMPRLWGLHNYRDANRHNSLRNSWTLWLTKHVKGTIWATETGGVVGQSQDGTGRILWPYSPSRAAKSLQHLFALLRAPAVRTRYQRVYVYSFFGAWSAKQKVNRWDSGLLTLAGRPRPAYEVLKSLTKLSLYTKPRKKRRR